MLKGERSGEAAAGARPAHGHQCAPLGLLRAFFRSDFDLGLSDSAIEASRRIWERTGGITVRLYSLRWYCLLRPLDFALGYFERQGRLGAFGRLVRPLGALAERGLKAMVASRTLPPAGCFHAPLRPEEVLAELERCRHYDLLPGYPGETLAWVLGKTAGKQRHGAFRARMVRDEKGEVLGWFVYHRDPGEASQVHQLYARPEATGRVFDCLHADAQASGTPALVGKADPLFFDHFTARHCLLRHTGWTLARARRPELLQPFLAGKALFSDLESEGWTRFIGAEQRGEFDR
jgi:hypothetical protein